MPWAIGLEGYKAIKPPGTPGHFGAPRAPLGTQAGHRKRRHISLNHVSLLGPRQRQALIGEFITT
eukprot:3559129-Pyramimonas_sp.AAC.2